MNERAPPSSHFLSFSGRARGRYVLIAFVLLKLVSAVAGALAEVALPLYARPTAETLVMALIIPTFVRRMHDTGRSGWWAIVPAACLVPSTFATIDVPPWDNLILAIPAAVLNLGALYLLIVHSDDDAGRFGPDPRIQSRAS